MLSSTPFSDEIILEIFEHLTDAELLSLATISKRIHDLALLSHLSRYGITEDDIASNSFPELTTSGAFPAFCIARFITGVDTLRLRFDPRAKLDQDVRALAKLSRKMPLIKSIDLEFCQWPARVQMAAVRRCDMEGLILTLISAYRSRPSVALSVLGVSVIRPQKPPFYGVHRLYSGVRALGSKKYGRTAPLIKEQEFRQELAIFPLMRAGGVIPNVSIRAFDPPSSLGTLLVLRASGISDLRFPPTLRLSMAEMSDIFANVKLPLLRSVEAPLWRISSASLHVFLCRHPSLHRLRLQGKADPPKSAKASSLAKREPLPPDALPQLKHMLGSVNLVAWVLASPHPFPQLTGVTIELHAGASTREYYDDTLQGIARRPALDILSLQIYDWHPWAKKNFDPARAPERNIPHLADLRLTFKYLPSIGTPGLPLLVEWLKLFRGVREVSLFENVPSRDICAVLGCACPQIKFVSYKLGK
ncbi:hypothetical protein DFH09DRAFT_1171839 [Mycena vulgaris]|nr:hypothetical protein DFH09DRAFT_1171839 [Mycena vulgaris]